jgi:4-amino-4-deoxy-L-arabinose transferase-like glycosyltransferase
MLPVPSNRHWLPMTSIVSAGSMELFGTTWRAGQLPMILLSAALVPFTYLIGWSLWRSRLVARAGAVLAIFGGPLLVMYPLVDNFAIFGAAGATALVCATQAVRAGHPGVWLVASGAAAGLATLARIDGALLAIAPAAAWLVRGSWAPVTSRLAWGTASALAFAAIVAPWLWRNVSVFGTALPSAGGHTLWLTTYNEQFTISYEPTLAAYLDWGVGNILGSKLMAWGELTGRTAVLLGGIFIIGFGYGLWEARRRPELAPFVGYFVGMFVVMGAVFTFHEPRGAFYHSAPAWLPFALPMAVAGMAPAADAFGRLWPFLRRARTQRFLIVAGLAGAIALSLVGSVVLVGQWSLARTRLEQAAAFLRGRDATGDVVMTYDPAALWSITGNPGVAPPFDGFEVIGDVAEAYDVRWVVVTFGPGESRDPLGLWDGAAGIDRDGRRPDYLPAAPAFEAPGVRVFEVQRGT